MSVQTLARPVRLGISWSFGEEPQRNARIELDAEVSRGARGVELRSSDPECPFQFAFRLDRAKESGAFTIELLYHKWNGRDLAQLPLLEQLLSFARCCAGRGRVAFEEIEYGERREILTTRVASSFTSQFRRTMSYLEMLTKLAVVIIKIGSHAKYSNTDVLTLRQAETLSLAYSLTHTASMPFSAGPCKATLTPEGRHALKSANLGPLQVQMPLRLHIGDTFLGEMPVKVTISDFAAVEHDDGTATFTPRGAAQIALDSEKLV